MEYKRLGDYIREVNVRNRELKVTKLVGLTIDKAFIPSVANVIGTDLSNYKVIQREQFACSLMQVSRDGKMPVAMFEEDEAIMSPAYPMFEITDKTVLMPQYLMMWFSRSEFDREASYYAVGGVRGSLTWEDFCNMRLPIPSITRQREIVAEYETLTNRICLNNQMIQHLEASAQALYRKTFVDNIDKENLPEGWRMGTLGEVVESYSKTHIFNKKELIFLNTSDVLDGKILLHESSIVENMPGQAKKEIANGDILFSEIRPANKRYAIVREEHPEDFVVSTKLMVLRIKDNSYSNLKVYFYLTLPDVLSDLQKQADGASGTFPQITFDGNLRNREIIIGDKDTEDEWERYLSVHFNNIWIREHENSKLTELQSLLLAKMGQ